MLNSTPLGKSQCTPGHHPNTNAIIAGRGLRKIRAVPSTAHGMLKFPIEGSTVTLQSSRVIPMECAMISGPSIQPLAANQVLEKKINIAIHRKFTEQDTDMTGNLVKIAVTSARISGRVHSAGSRLGQKEKRVPQIKMAKVDEEKTAFITSQGIFLHSKLPLRSKKMRVLISTIVEEAFQRQIGLTLDINMKLNPKKCTFGMQEGMFLGYKCKANQIEKDTSNELHGRCINKSIRYKATGVSSRKYLVNAEVGSSSVEGYDINTNQWTRNQWPNIGGFILWNDQKRVSGGTHGRIIENFTMWKSDFRFEATKTKLEYVMVEEEGYTLDDTLLRVPDKVILTEDTRRPGAIWTPYQEKFISEHGNQVVINHLNIGVREMCISQLLSPLHSNVGEGKTPFSLAYGTEAVIPAEIGMPTLRTAEVDQANNNEALGINLDLIEERREQAAIQEAKSKKKMEKYYILRSSRNELSKTGRNGLPQQ
ncbi:hypothetical protein Tco_1428381 [Tanacetum coccineum]